MVDELLELLEGVEFILLVTVVKFFEVLFDLLAVVEEANLDEIEQQEQVELLALLKGRLVLAEDQHQP